MVSNLTKQGILSAMKPHLEALRKISPESDVSKQIIEPTINKVYTVPKKSPSGDVKVTKEPDVTKPDLGKIAMTTTPLGFSSLAQGVLGRLITGGSVEDIGKEGIETFTKTDKGNVIIEGKPEDVATYTDKSGIFDTVDFNTGSNGKGLFDFDLGDTLDLTTKMIPLVLILALIGGITRILK